MGIIIVLYQVNYWTKRLVIFLLNYTKETNHNICSENDLCKGIISFVICPLTRQIEAIMNTNIMDD